MSEWAVLRCRKRGLLAASRRFYRYLSCVYAARQFRAARLYGSRSRAARPLVYRRAISRHRLRRARAARRPVNVCRVSRAALALVCGCNRLLMGCGARRPQRWVSTVQYSTVRCGTVPYSSVQYMFTRVFTQRSLLACVVRCSGSMLLSSQPVACVS